MSNKQLIVISYDKTRQENQPHQMDWLKIM